MGRVTFRLQADDSEKLTSLANRRDKNVSDYLRFLINEAWVDIDKFAELNMKIVGLEKQLDEITNLLKLIRKNAYRSYGIGLEIIRISYGDEMTKTTDLKVEKLLREIEERNK